MTDHLNWSAVSMYCQMGVRVFPLVHGTKVPLLSGNWKDHATSDTAKALQVFPANGHWSIAASLGPDSRICDVEVDSEKLRQALGGRVRWMVAAGAPL